MLVATFVCLLGAFAQTRALLHEPHGPIRAGLVDAQVLGELKRQLGAMARSEDALLFQIVN